MAGKPELIGNPWKGLSGKPANPIFWRTLMRTRTGPNIPPPLSLARRQFEQWRNRQQGRKRLPPKLWAKAVTLAQAYGLNRTARTLGVKHDSLKKHLETVATDASDPGKARAEFLELLPRQMNPSSLECVIELEEAGGVTTRMQVKGVGIPDLVSFARMFRDGRA